MESTDVHSLIETVTGCVGNQTTIEEQVPSLYRSDIEKRSLYDAILTTTQMNRKQLNPTLPDPNFTTDLPKGGSDGPPLLSQLFTIRSLQTWF